MRRKVQLWRFVDEDGAPGRPVPVTALHRMLVAADAAAADLTYTDAYDYETQLEPVAATGHTGHYLLHRIRAEDLPSQRRGGRVVELDPSVDELAEGSHVLMLQRNLVAVLGTGFSPRAGRLAEWMRFRLGWDLWLEPVLRQDVGLILSNLRKITSVEVKILADEARRLDLSGFFEGDSDPLGALQTAQRAQQGGIITVGWSVGQGSDADQGWFQRLIDRLHTMDPSRFRAARANVYVEHSESLTPVDFLHDRIVAEVEVDQPPGRQRLLPNDVAYGALQEAWTQFRDIDRVLDGMDPTSGTPFTVPQTLHQT